jgi:hypothetical protein
MAIKVAGLRAWQSTVVPSVIRPPTVVEWFLRLAAITVIGGQWFSVNKRLPEGGTKGFGGSPEKHCREEESIAL